MTNRNVSAREAFDRAFGLYRCHAILRAGCSIGLVAVRFPKDGGGRVEAFLHIFGCQITRGSASGGGYDKATTAVAVAASKLEPSEEDSDAELIRASLVDGGFDYVSQLGSLGFVLARGC